MGAAVRLVPPCTYQGGKQRLSAQIVDFIDAREGLLAGDAAFCDVCCGSGAVSLELLGRGFPAGRIRMCDAGPWGTFWKAVGTGSFDMGRLDRYLSGVPGDRAAVRGHVERLAATDASVDTAYVFLLLQAASFGGKQVWREGSRWRHSSFRDYWQPTGTSVRHSPVNPMQPRPEELRRRVAAIVGACRGISCVDGDVSAFHVEPGSVVYVDPPYPGMTGYGYGFDVLAHVRRFLEEGAAAVYVSLNRPLSADAVRLRFGGPKGGISASRAGRWEEWLSVFHAGDF